jgi:hypothetical protein
MPSNGYGVIPPPKDLSEVKIKNVDTQIGQMEMVKEVLFYTIPS